MTEGHEFTAKQFLDAIPGSGGIIASVARKVGCDWHTAKRFIERHPTALQAYINESNKIDDLAESTIIKAIQEGDVSTAKWWLSKKRPNTFGERVDVTSGGQRIEPVTIIEVVLDAGSGDESESPIPDGKS